MAFTPDGEQWLRQAEYLKQALAIVGDLPSPGPPTAVVGAGIYLGLLSAVAIAGFGLTIVVRRAATPYAIVAVILLFLPAQYFFGAFTHDGFLAQTVSTLFAVAMWWAMLQWEDQPGIAGASVMSPVGSSSASSNTRRFSSCSAQIWLMAAPPRSW